MGFNFLFPVKSCPFQEDLLDGRPDTKGTVEDTIFFFFLGLLVQSHCGEGGWDAANK